MRCRAPAPYALLELARALHPGVLSWDRGGPYVAGLVIVVAAAYQLTSLKDACGMMMQDGS